MANSKINNNGTSPAEWYFAKPKWQMENNKLREIILSFGLVEDLKWGKPTYSYKGGNVLLIHGFKDYVAILFFKGSLIIDHLGMLIQQTPQVQAARQLRFGSVEVIVDNENYIKEYIASAILVEKKGLKVEFAKPVDMPFSEEFTNMLDETDGLRDAFEKLTPGRQKGYLLYINGAKQSKTRLSRVESNIDRILSGKGLEDV